MKKIIDIIKNKIGKTLSFELFPPKTEAGYDKLIHTLAELSQLHPDFMSCTYGAGGGNRDKTFDIVQHIQNQHHIPAMAHLTCVLNSKTDIHYILENIKSRNIRNILALRGDPPTDHPDWQPTEENLKYSSDLCAFIKKRFNDDFSIAVAGFPEGHVLCPDKEQDAKFLKCKIDNGADFVLTQLFFNNQDYFDYCDRLKRLGINVPVIPGILPIKNYQSLLNFTSRCGATVTQEIHNIFEPIQDDTEATYAAGIDFAIKQCRNLLENGAPGLHFYTLNKVSPCRKIISECDFKS